jgi:hypothetical protein
MATDPATPAPLAIRAMEAARLLSISERTLFALSQPRGPIPCIRLNRSVRYSVDALRRYVEEAGR